MILTDVWHKKLWRALAKKLGGFCGGIFYYAVNSNITKEPQTQKKSELQRVFAECLFFWFL